MPHKNCQRCGADFVTRKSWAVYCYDCYRDRAKLLEQFDEFFIDADAAIYLHTRVDQLTAELQQRPLAHDPAPAIPPPILRRLIQLCHPDRHGGSDAARLATLWLLEQRSLQ